MGNKGKIIAAIIIWIGVMYFGYRTYERVRPALFGLPRNNGRVMAQQDWQKLQARMDEFLKEDVPTSIKLSVKRAKSMGGFSNIQFRDNGFFAAAYGMRVADIYSLLSGKPNWQITQIPAANDQRWDFELRCPTASKEKAADYFLNYMHWAVREKTISRPGYHFVESGGTLSAPPLDPKKQRGGMRIPPFSIGQFANNMQWMIRAPIKVDDSIKDRKPGDEKKEIPWGLDSDKTAALIADAYGIGVKRENMDANAILIYHPKYSSHVEIGKWEQGF
jgi:hypothetical protein